LFQGLVLVFIWELLFSSKFQQAPFIMADSTAPSGYKGLCVDLMDLITKYENITYELKIVSKGRYGRVNDSGEWNGIIRHLIDKTADVGLGALSVTAERESVVDFTVPFYDLVGFRIMMQDVQPQNSIFKFLTVLETNVWLCMLGIYLFASCLMWVFARFGAQPPVSESDDDGERRDFNLAECLWFCMTSLTPQGGGDAPRNISGRLVAATWWLYGFIIIASYTANLAAFLTIKRIEKDVETLDDLALQYKVEYAPEEGSHAQEFFQRMAGIEKQFYECVCIYLF
jgi:glutamate receptor, ionotropic, invertebrate